VRRCEIEWTKLELTCCCRSSQAKWSFPPNLAATRYLSVGGFATWGQTQPKCEIAGVISCLVLKNGGGSTTISNISMVAMASEVKLDLSMRITRHGDHAKVAIAAEVSVVAAMPCAVDGLSLTVGLEAVNTPSSDGPRAADSQFKRRAWPGQIALDVAKNLLGWKVEKCVNLPRKTGSEGLANRPVRLRARRSVHGCHGVGSEAGPVHADHAPRRPRQGGNSCRGVCSRGYAVRSGWVHVNGRDCM
jgi:hypothetical protein